MEKLLLFVLLNLCFALNAQTSQKVGYQAIVRDGQGHLITNKNIGVRLTVMQEGVEVYQETHLSKTNANGLFSLEIGGGTVISGNFGTINWGNGKRTMLESAIDLNGGWNYTLFSLTDVLSVPYAIHAQTAQRLVENPQESDPLFTASPAKNITNINIANWNAKQNTLQAGEGITIINDTIRAVLAFAEAETDPLFQQHLAYSLTERDTAHWNNKLDQETDPLFSASVAKNITETDVNYWNKKVDSVDLETMKTDIEILQKAKAELAFVNAILIRVEALTKRVESLQKANETLEAEIEALKKAVEDLRIANGYIKDIDNNIYKTVKIGTQIWMAENLKVTRFNNGDSIAYIQESNRDIWNYSDTIPPAYCHYNYDSELGKIYGNLYNWYVIGNTGSNQQNAGRKICPTGWHIPLVSEWNTMIDFCVSQGYNYNSLPIVSGVVNGLAKALALPKLWHTSNTYGTGTLGYPDYQEKFNISGFSALPAGYRRYDGDCEFLTTRTNFHTNSPTTSMIIECAKPSIYSCTSAPYFGYPIRCVKD